MTSKKTIERLELAPFACIVCGKPKPDGETKDCPGWTYIADAIPVGALTCSEECFQVVLDRHERTGRVDTTRDDQLTKERRDLLFRLGHPWSTRVE
jgi:predicted nucleic acid-binding Zn ribbon protein